MSILALRGLNLNLYYINSTADVLLGAKCQMHDIKILNCLDFN